MATPTATSPPRAASFSPAATSTPPPASSAARSLLSEAIHADRSRRSYQTIASDDEAEDRALSPPLMQGKFSYSWYPQCTSGDLTRAIGLTSYFLPRVSPPPEPVELTTMEQVWAVFSRWCVCFGSRGTDREEEEDIDEGEDEENENSSSDSEER